VAHWANGDAEVVRRTAEKLLQFAARICDALDTQAEAAVG
jgi:hypothetical protein